MLPLYTLLVPFNSHTRLQDCAYVLGMFRTRLIMCNHANNVEYAMVAGRQLGCKDKHGGMYTNDYGIDNMHSSCNGQFS